MWLYPDGSRILEISTKACRTKPSRSAPSSRPTWRKLGVSLAAQQETKTKTAMEFFKAKIQSDLGGVVPATTMRSGWAIGSP